jgi:cation:H+ antiporter
MDILVLILSLVLVTLGAEALVRGASAVALGAGVSPLFVGLTIVGFGTSSPELAASLTATLKGSSGVSLGNAIGSNLFNIGVILGVTALFYPIRIRLYAIRRDLLVALVVACAPWISIGFGGVLPRWVGWSLVGMLLVYLGWAYRAGRRAGAEDAELATAEVQTTLGIDPVAPERPARVWGNVALVVVGLGLLVVGSHWFVLSAIDIARGWGVSELVIGLTIVSAGTSLPELVTSVVAAWRRNPDIAIGNILGSNIFNILGVLGASAAVAPLTVSPHVLLIDVPLMVVATAALLPIMRTGGVISRREGGVLLGGYGLYLGILILRGS